jgi:TRAP-type mannitol/chloroaromatic compound transport system substrate-binding protein
VAARTGGRFYFALSQKRLKQLHTIFVSVCPLSKERSSRPLVGDSFMDRRGFLKSASGVIAVAATGSHAAVAGPSPSANLPAPSYVKGRRILQVALAWPDNGQGFGDVAQSFATTVSDLTDAALQVSYTPLSHTSLGTSASAPQVPGELDGVFGVERVLFGHDRASSYFVGLPGDHGLTGRELQLWLSMGGGQSLWDEVASEVGLKPLLVGHSGGPSVLWARKPMDERTSFLNQSLVAEGLARDVAIGLGSEIADDLTVTPGRALAAGKVDLCDAAGLAASVADGLPGTARYLYQPGFYRHGIATAIGLNLEAWHGLSRAHAAVVELAASKTFANSLDWASAHSSLMQAALLARRDVEVLQLHASVASAINRVSDAVVAHVAANGPRARRINAQHLAFRNRMRAGQQPASV